MGAARFAAAIAARERADPEYHRRAAARRALGREIWKLETKYRGQIEDLRRDLAATQTALTEAQATNNRLQRQLQAGDETFRKELGIAHESLNALQAENERLRRRLKQCDAVNRLIAAVTPEDNDRP
jgi:hypothetical protein